MVKIYRFFMRMAVECVRKSGGVTRQFLGDRIMGVFIDSVNEKNEVIFKAVDKAIEVARSLQTVIDFSLNKHLKTNVNGKMIECDTLENMTKEKSLEDKLFDIYVETVGDQDEK